MFGNMGLHVIRNPAGTYSYVGSVPVELATERPATVDDIMGGRAHLGQGGIVTWKFPIFETREAAVEFAEEKGYKVEGENNHG